MAKMNKNINRLVIEKPVVGGSVDVWGNIINKDLDNIGAFADEVATKMDTHDQELANLKNDKVSKNEVEATITPIVNNYVENTVKPSLDAYEKEKEQELDTFKETKTTEITAHADKEKERITTEINNVAGTAKQSVTNEGTKQTGLVAVEGNKVIEQVKTLVEGNPATTNALTLSGKTRAEFEKEAQGVIGEYAGTFPLTSAVQNKVYYIPTIGKYYRCKTAYSGTQLTMPNGNFEEISTSINSDRLGNLLKYVTLNPREEYILGMGTFIISLCWTGGATALNCSYIVSLTGYGVEEIHTTWQQASPLLSSKVSFIEYLNESCKIRSTHERNERIFAILKIY